MNKIRIISNNKKLYYNYNIIDTLECGIVLNGTEVKSIRVNPGAFNITNAYVKIIKNETILIGSNIPIYNNGAFYQRSEIRDRNLLLKKKEMHKLSSMVKEKRLTIVVSKSYWKGKYIKLEIALVKGKNTIDKKIAIKERDIQRDLLRDLKI